MTLHLPDLAYDCISCGKSCTLFEVELLPDEVARLDYHALRVLDSGRTYLQKKADGTCVYLTPDQLCQIHAEQGFAAKPWTCQTFPFGAEPTPDGVFLGLSFACTAVARQLGRPLEEHRAELSPRYAPQTFDGGWRLWEDTPLEWERYRQIEARLSAGLERHLDLGLLLGAAAVARAVKTGDWSRLDEDPPLTPDFGAQADSLLSGLLTLIETAGAPSDRIEGVLRAFGRGGTYYSSILEREVDLGQLGDLPDDYARRTRLYLDHLLFRKTLLKPPDVLSRACLLPLVGHALRYYTQASGDWEVGVSIMEGRLMYHARGMESYFQRIARGFLDQV